MKLNYSYFGAQSCSGNEHLLRSCEQLFGFVQMQQEEIESVLPGIPAYVTGKTACSKLIN